MRRLGFEDEMVIAMWAVFITGQRSVGTQQSMYHTNHLSSNSSMFFRNAFLHFLHAKVISMVLVSWWFSASPWHCAQSNHLRPACINTARCSHQPILTARRSDRNLCIKDVLAGRDQQMLALYQVDLPHDDMLSLSRCVPRAVQSRLSY